MSNYEVERSSDGFNFELIGKVQPAENLGVNSYNFIDQNANRINYYRLKVIDTDGTFEYSKIVQAEVDCVRFTGLAMKLFPNPITKTDEIINVSFNSGFNRNAEVTIYDELGQLVFSTTLTAVKGGNEFKIELPTLASGKYLFSMVVDENGTIKTLPFVKVD